MKKKKSLQEIRKQIDTIDEKLLALLDRRNRLSAEVGQIKRASGKAVFAPDREEVLMRELEKKNKGALPPEALRAIFREILSASRLKQKQLKIAYLGPEATHCHQAALERFGKSDCYLSCATIPHIFETITREEADAGVVPIENSIEGGVSASLDALVRSDLNICGEMHLRISHGLMCAKRTTKIERIYSHPQAFGQCRQWLLNNYPGVEYVEVSSTSEGARRCKSEARSGAIASKFAAEFYGLRILKSHIQDVEKNLTRFLIMSREMPAPTKADKTSLIFAVSHQVGALGRILRCFSEFDLNLNKIESRPVSHKPGEYLFFVDVQGHSQQPPLSDALREIQQNTLWLKVLGSYPEKRVRL
ncbi:MAG: prephenate dehydratase [Verrucomicrobiota bacterium]